MTGAYVDKNYVYAVARVRAEENKLFSMQMLSELMSLKNVDMIKRSLKEKGFGKEDADFLTMIHNEKSKLWEFVDEIVPDRSTLSVFRVSNDFHNLKAAIKESIAEYKVDNIYIEDSEVPINLIKECIKNKAYGDLPLAMIDVARDAHDIFLKTQDSQLCDVIIDKACIESIVRHSKKSNNDYIKLYANLLAVSSLIKVCVRASITNKNKEWIEKALPEVDILDRDTLIKVSLDGLDSICNYLQNTEYSDAVPMIKKSLTSFEKWCDDLIIDRMKGMLYESFGLGPIIAYILAKENEIKNIRIIYTGIQNGFSEEMIRERVRETYV